MCQRNIQSTRQCRSPRQNKTFGTGTSLVSYYYSSPLCCRPVRGSRANRPIGKIRIPLMVADAQLQRFWEPERRPRLCSAIRDRRICGGRNGPEPDAVAHVGTTGNSQLQRLLRKRDNDSALAGWLIGTLCLCPAFAGDPIRGKGCCRSRRELPAS